MLYRSVMCLPAANYKMYSAERWLHMVSVSCGMCSCVLVPSCQVLLSLTKPRSSYALYLVDHLNKQPGEGQAVWLLGAQLLLVLQLYRPIWDIAQHVTPAAQFLCCPCGSLLATDRTYTSCTQGKPICQVLLAIDYMYSSRAGG